ncbi:MAG: DNA mismatch repair endonuclease MutL [Candidatus Thermoplasmatota archaeon]|nr:DNA mismatch repair endonuclease MutL [Candidatus Thermoplasmatota archaeon]
MEYFEGRVEMPEIMKLSEHTVNQIAAGEVIERPASVVKELLENSIDSGATRIEIDVVNGGKKLIKVTDNGRGIREDEIEIAFLKHTTSKIREIDDVYALTTMGFRGEALASIASVAKVEAFSKHSEASTEIGRHIFISGGKLIYNEKHAALKGTSIKVLDLFFNLPARKKYLKTTATELKHIIKLVTSLAMINPEIHFILKNNRRPLLNFPSCSDERENLFHILGASETRKMVSLDHTMGSVRVKGHLGVPDFTRSTRSGQWFFVNGRSVDSKVIRESLEDAFKSIIMRNKHPVAIISVRINPKDMDVNIHPTKREVKFQNRDAVYAAVFEAVRKALEMEGISVKKPSPSRENNEDTRMGTGRLETSRNMEERSLQTTLMEDVNHAAAHGSIPGSSIKWEQSGFGTEPIYYRDYRENHERHGLPLLRSRGQINNLYIIAESEDGLVIIDQHALHERIMLEKVTEQYSRKAMAMQELIVPLDIALSSEQSAVFDEWKDRLARIGFGIEHFGGDSYRVRHIPASIQLREAKKLVLNIIDKLVEEGRDVSLEEMDNEILKMTACKSAIKAGQPLDRAGIDELFCQMYRAENPFFCAHGRPTMVKMSLGELERRFKRKV